MKLRLNSTQVVVEVEVGVELGNKRDLCLEYYSFFPASLSILPNPFSLVPFLYFHTTLISLLYHL